MKFATLALTLVMSFGAYAADEEKAEGQSSLKVEDVSGKKNTVDGNVDDEITNAKLRAESGSKSKWSGSFTGTYEGGSLTKPMSKDRPNNVNDPVAPKVRMLGDIGVRYRIDKNNSLKLATGYTLQRPFQEAKRGSVSDPALTWDNASKFGPVQNVSDVIVTGMTNSDATEVGQLAQLGLTDVVLYDFGGSKLTVGLAAEVYYNYYTKKNEMVQPKGQDRAPSIAYQEPFQLGAYPLAEYALSDMFQLRTVFRPWTFSKLATSDSWTFDRRPWTQSAGLVIAATRDINLYPNFQWDVERWRREGYSFAGKRTRETSTVGLNATINMF